MSTRRLTWVDEAWEDYVYWQSNDAKTLKRINALIRDTLRGDPFTGIGKPEPLRGALTGLWSRRITQEHRLVYSVDEEQVTILQARFHY